MNTVNRHKGILITAETVGDHVNLLVAGELNSGTSARLEAEVRRLMLKSHYRLVVSLENVSLITSAGLRVLLVLAKELRQKGGDIALYDSQPNVLEIFSMTGFDTILSLSDSYEQAVKAVGGSLATLNAASSQDAAKPVWH